MNESKATSKEAAKSLIDSYSNGDEFTVEDCKSISSLCGWDFDQVKKVKHRMISVVCPSEKYSGTWSWNKSIDGYCKEKNTIQAMRTAIRSGTYADHEMTSCESCGNDADLTVDHKSTPFSEIALQFNREHGSPCIYNMNGYGWLLKDKHAFVGFHDAIADYQTLCRSCNSAKGSKIK